MQWIGSSLANDTSSSTIAVAVGRALKFQCERLEASFALVFLVFALFHPVSLGSAFRIVAKPLIMTAASDN